MKKTLVLIVLFTISGNLYAQNDHKWHHLFDDESINKLRGYRMDIIPDARKVEEGAWAAQDRTTSKTRMRQTEHSGPIDQPVPKLRPKAQAKNYFPA